MFPHSARYFGRLVAGEVSRLAYGNDAGVVNNVRGRAGLRAVQRKMRGAVSHEQHVWQAATGLFRNGWAPLAPTLDTRTIDELRSRCEVLLEDPAHSVDLGFAPRVDAVRHIVEPVSKVPDLARLLSDDAIEVLRTVYAAELEVRSVRVWRTIHVPDENLSTSGRLRRRRSVSVMSNLMHCDTHPVSMTKLFVQLSPGVDAESGALHLLPIAATKQAMRSGFLRPDVVVGPARRVVSDIERLVHFDGPPGSGLLLNSELCLHAAGVPRAGSTRLMAQFVLAPAAVPLPTDWASSLSPDVEILAQVG
jgi:hypothetical protein